MVDRLIAHADLDAFYASVEQRDNPALRGVPVVVGGAPEERGVVAAASYEARRFGIHSAMAMAQALRLCPEAVRLRPRFPIYAEVSATVLDLYRSLTPVVEPISLDEAYLDLTGRLPEPIASQAMGEELKRRVKDAVGLTVSVGIAASKSVAKIASDLQKPDGLVLVANGDEQAFLAQLPVGRLWGVGPRATDRLARLNVRTIGDLATVDSRLLVSLFGRLGAMLHELANGIDERAVAPNREIKSIARETTFVQDVYDVTVLEATLATLAEGVAERLRRHSLRGRTVTLKLRQADFTTLSRQNTLPSPVDDGHLIAQQACDLLRRELHSGRSFRLIGVALSGFDSSAQLALPLFDEA